MAPKISNMERWICGSTLPYGSTFMGRYAISFHWALGANLFQVKLLMDKWAEG